MFDVRATFTVGGEVPWRVLAVSADATLLDLHLALLGAFEWRGSYSREERDYRVHVGGKTFEDGRGSRTALRKLIDIGSELRFESRSGAFFIVASVMGSYEVRSRRHYPKVLDGDGVLPDRPRSSDPAASLQIQTWKAQAASRRELRDLPEIAQASPDASERGFLTAIVSGPSVMPSAWLDVLLERRWASADDAERVAQQIFQAYNDALELLQDPGNFVQHMMSLAREDSDELVQWCNGYLSAIDRSEDEWASAFKEERFRRAISPIVIGANFNDEAAKRGWLEDEGSAADLAEAVGLSALFVSEYCHERQAPVETYRRDQPKVGANAPCPCGSGKKYKRCCSPVRSAPPAACGLCGDSRRVTTTPCCGRPICDDADRYVAFSYARNSCYRNHDHHTLCAFHHSKGHDGEWQLCERCRNEFEPEMYAWYGTNEYNFETLANPAPYEPTHCARCNGVIRLSEESYRLEPNGKYVCERCSPIVFP